MKPDEFKEKMEQLAADNDQESFHVSADDLICEIMRELGYGDGIDIFERHEKWYS